jgi:hypothetical protein
MREGAAIDEKTLLDKRISRIAACTRLQYYGTGELLTLRNHTPADIAATAQRLLNRPGRRMRTDSGEQVARVILETARRGLARDTALDGRLAAP